MMDFQSILDDFNLQNPRYFHLMSKVEAAFEQAEKSSPDKKDADFLFDLKKTVLMEMQGRITGKILDDNQARNERDDIDNQ